LAASREAPLCVMLLHGPGHRLLALRNTIGPDGVSWIEDLDPESLEARHRSPDLDLGPFWPGGAAVLADGSVVVIQGRWAHRLNADLSVAARRALPVDAPHNSFVVLDDGSVVTKDLQRPGGPPSTIHVLDPETLDDRADPLTLTEPCVARLTADGNDLVVVGVSALHRHTWVPARGTWSTDPHPTTYLTRDDQSFGWDPVVDAAAVWWLDNGDHTFEQGFTMLGNGVADGPIRLWRKDADGALSSVEVSGRRGGAATNPPVVDPDRHIVVAFDSANGILAAFSTDDLTCRWRRDVAASQHQLLFADTGELITNDFDRDTGDSLVVLDVESGQTRAGAPVESAMQSVVFGAPGFGRDAYYASLTRIARVTFGD
jgi:hypothetical protein